MYVNKNEQLIYALKQSVIYSLQLDQSTDIAGNTNLSIKDFINYCQWRFLWSFYFIVLAWTIFFDVSVF